MAASAQGGARDYPGRPAVSDISIPGVTQSKYGTDKLIEGLMKIERVPRDNAQTQLDTYQKQKAVWLDLTQQVSGLRDTALTLYSFRNPFSDRIATSSDESVLTAAATREALEQSSKIVVEKVATADRFLSSNLPPDYKVPGGTYHFDVGSGSIELSFLGGSLQDFADAVTKKGRDLVRASLVSVTSDTRALVLESLKTGEKNKLGLSGDSEKLALAIGMVEKASTKAQTLDPSQPTAWTKPLDPSTVRVNKTALDVDPGGEAKLPLATDAQTAGLVLEISYRLVKPPEAPPPTPPPGPNVPATGSITYQGITVQGAPSMTGLPPWTPPPTPPHVDDSKMIFALAANGGSVALPALSDSSDVQTTRIDLGPLMPDIAAIGARNGDSSRKLEIVSARVFDPKESGGLKPTHPISTAADAMISVDGVDIRRDTNAIKDVIPGVTLNLVDTSDKPVKVDVEPDRKSAKDAIINLVGSYNKLMGWLNILTRDDPAIIDQLDYFTDAEKKSAQERLGLYQGDSTLSVFRSGLQSAMMNPHETRPGDSIVLLSQIGIATDTRRPGSAGGVDASRLRGYLEIDEPTLDKALASNFDQVRDLFGYDTNGDYIINSGVAYAVETAAQPYVSIGGIFATRSQTLDQEIASEKNTIANLDESLATKQEDLKRKYGMMEGALQSMDATSNSIDNFSKNNSGG